MPDYQIKFTFAQGGRSSRDLHSVVLRGAPDGALNRTEASDFATAMAGAFAAVLFAPTHIIRATFTELDENNRAVRNSNFKVPLALVGVNALPNNDGSSIEQVCLRIEKAADPSGSGTTLLRHVLTANEYAAYTNAGTIPARFSAAPEGAYGEGQALGVNMLQAANQNNWTLKLKPITRLLSTTERTVVHIAAQDFGIVSVTKTRIDPMAKIRQGVQQEMDEIWRRFHRMYDTLGEQIPAGDVLQTLWTLVTSYYTAYNGLAAAERVLIRLKPFPALPQLPGN